MTSEGYHRFSVMWDSDATCNFKLNVSKFYTLNSHNWDLNTEVHCLHHWFPTWDTWPPPLVFSEMWTDISPAGAAVLVPENNGTHGNKWKHSHSTTILKNIFSYTLCVIFYLKSFISGSTPVLDHGFDQLGLVLSLHTLLQTISTTHGPVNSPLRS